MSSEPKYLHAILAAVTAAILTGLYMQNLMEREQARMLHEMTSIARQAAEEARGSQSCYSGYAGNDGDCIPDPDDLPDSNLPSPI